MNRVASCNKAETSLLPSDCATCVSEPFADLTWEWTYFVTRSLSALIMLMLSGAFPQKTQCFQPVEEVALQEMIGLVAARLLSAGFARGGAPSKCMAYLA